MLVLSRRRSESVIVGGTSGPESIVRVTVLDIRAGSVRLGFESADRVPIHRQEVRERICARGPPCKQTRDREAVAR
jgi:carbon storage regulator CsrA